MDQISTFSVYEDIQKRTNGEMYIGVVGPVRTGKSTFIKRFMDLCVIPNIEDDAIKKRAIDELPQSARGATIMTTEPKFVPANAVKIAYDKNTLLSVRLIDCVGFVVAGASGIEEDGKERMVKTPWYDYDIPFTKAASIGTKKVIKEHSTIGIVITTDGTIGDIPRENYIEAEEKTIEEIRKIGKPFTLLLNSKKPFAAECKALCKELEEKYQVTCLAVNVDQLKKEDITKILTSILGEFPITKFEFFIPAWSEMLPMSHPIKQEMIEQVKQIMGKWKQVKDIDFFNDEVELKEAVYLKAIRMKKKSLSDGIVQFEIDIPSMYYYQTISQLTNTKIKNEYELLEVIKDYSEMKNEYVKVQGAMQAVRGKGYGIMTPAKEEIQLEEPEVIRSGNKFGVKIKALAPSIHFIKTDVLTEIAPIVGDEQQAEDLKDFIIQNAKSENGIWNTNIFGKTIEQIVEDGIHTKLSQMSEETQGKMQKTLQKITNESNKGVICIIF